MGYLLNTGASSREARARNFRGAVLKDLGHQPGLVLTWRKGSRMVRSGSHPAHGYGDRSQWEAEDALSVDLMSPKGPLL